MLSTFNFLLCEYVLNIVIAQLIVTTSYRTTPMLAVSQMQINSLFDAYELFYLHKAELRLSVQLLPTALLSCQKVALDFSDTVDV
ncbi:hypothetical protein NQ317_006222 [Molorchus minor]|uniref:Secreted protein n=1 Tax=Molorchus minor TaxID=1323400 RepID=A0ABQ9K8J0_9CUCU|nr:hypothetical protein NQ317_006222 [Molorchus minor]